MKTIAVIGGSGGLGKKVSQYLSKKRFWVDDIISLSSKDLDVRDFKACHEFFYNNNIDIVINLSGVNYDKFIHKLGQEDQYRINHLLDVNIHGTINILSTCLPLMRERGYGRVILISSILATKNVPGTALYSGCKAFIDRFAKSASVENISKGVTVNSIQLGYFDGGLTYKLNDQDSFKKEIPLKRWGTIEELCSTIEYFINNEYATGMNLPLNGGL